MLAQGRFGIYSTHMRKRVVKVKKKGRSKENISEYSYVCFMKESTAHHTNKTLLIRGSVNLEYSPIYEPFQITFSCK